MGDELITYTGVRTEAPWGFTGCERGAHGTKASAHGGGAEVGHLKECFGLFVPDPETTLFGEVAGKAAETANTCGFDMTYMDALDGEDILGGGEWGWHYGSKYVFEFYDRVDHPVLFEASTFHHHIWWVRSRYGAWDYPFRSDKRFIDTHVESNRGAARMFLPANLGWWSIKTWNGVNFEPSFRDNIEYLCCKALGSDTGLSIMGINPETMKRAVFKRLGGIISTYEAPAPRGALCRGRQGTASPTGRRVHAGSGVRRGMVVPSGGMQHVQGYRGAARGRGGEPSPQAAGACAHRGAAFGRGWRGHRSADRLH